MRSVVNIQVPNPFFFSRLPFGFTGPCKVPGSSWDYTQRVSCRHFNGQRPRPLLEEINLQGDLQTGQWRASRVQISSLQLIANHNTLCHRCFFFVFFFKTMWTCSFSWCTTCFKLYDACRNIYCCGKARISFASPILQPSPAAVSVCHIKPLQHIKYAWLKIFWELRFFELQKTLFLSINHKQNGDHTKVAKCLIFSKVY